MVREQSFYQWPSKYTQFTKGEIYKNEPLCVRVCTYVYTQDFLQSKYRPLHAWFLNNAFVHAKLVCVQVHPPPLRLLITTHMIALTNDTNATSK